MSYNAFMHLLRPGRLSFLFAAACLSFAAAFATEAQAACPASAPVACGSVCCPYQVDGGSNVCCSDQTCAKDGFCGGGACPSNAPIQCGAGCCPRGANGVTNVCCPDGTCTSDGQCAGDGTSDQCPSNASVRCPANCCPYEHDGGVKTCCADNTCTADGQCEGRTNTGTLSDGGACPQSASVSCGDHCCPPGHNGRTDVCCADGACTLDGVCGQPDAGADAAASAASSEPPSDEGDGCGCRTAGSSSRLAEGWYLVALGLAFGVRRTQRRM